ncbi:sensor histidine kinase [Amycolatopsis thermoflava]|uniref:sensor histidine kinase n=1 Tax=Amycolatopsis thermoflava TaxID=84480 RepID=UPI0038058B61
MPADTAASLRAVVRQWPRLPVLVKDTALAVVVAVLAFVPAISHIGPEIGDLPRRDAGAVAGLVLTLALCLPLAVRTRWPAVCLALVGSAFAVGQVLGYPDTFGKMGLLLALYAAGAHLARFHRRLAAAVTVAYAVLAVVLHTLGAPARFLDYLAFYLMMAVIWLAGTGVRRWRAEQAERERLAAEVATSTERARIARDLHDVVTHHVTAMVVQADAAQFLLDTEPARAGDGLSAISDTGRRALTELRALLDVLEATGDNPVPDRTPAIGRVSDLVEQARLSGQPVEWTEEGVSRPQPVDVELAAYRVVQEALTNAIKHATGQPTTVLLRHGEEHLEIEVTTTGPATAPVAPSGGRGLRGLRERLRMLDGDLVAGPRPDGGFRVHALIPSGSAA